MTIALYTRYLEKSSRKQFQLLADSLHSQDIDTIEVTDSLPDSPLDFLFSFGGDGTLLSSVHLIGSRNIPVLGINYGHLGFLTTAGRDDTRTLVTDLLAGHYNLEPRTLLHVRAQGGGEELSTFALNEVTLHRLDDDTLLRADLYVDNDFVSTYTGDGLIVATPTGSTAYSLSCGGPILTPNSGCFVVTPIAAHNLTLRPIIVPDSARLRLVTHPRQQLFDLGTDSRRQHLACGTEVILSREDFTVSLVRLHHQNFFSAIHQKLSWGTDAPIRRNEQ